MSIKKPITSNNPTRKCSMTRAQWFNQKTLPHKDASPTNQTTTKHTKQPNQQQTNSITRAKWKNQNNLPNKHAHPKLKHTKQPNQQTNKWQEPNDWRKQTCQPNMSIQKTNTPNQQTKTKHSMTKAKSFHQTCLFNTDAHPKARHTKQPNQTHVQ